MSKLLRNALAAAGVWTGVAIATQVAAQVTFYEYQGFSGRSYTTEKQIRDFALYGFNDRASSVEVVDGCWEVCEDSPFNGNCMVLRPGRYPSLAAMGLNDRISSMRSVRRNVRVDDRRYAPIPVLGQGVRGGRDERLYEANVTAVHAVVGPTEQRCRVEREQVVQARRGGNVGGAVVGAIIGGILGHQLGGGRGQDVATAGGAVVGAVVGSKIGRGGNGQQMAMGNVERCDGVPSPAQLELWDVTYNFRGQEHRVQTIARPGKTLTVNERGEPRE